MFRLLDTLREAELAETTALQLRRLHSTKAESVCLDEIARYDRRDPNHRFWVDVRRSLRWVKVEPTA